MLNSDKIFRLQFLNHKEVFDTRELAIEYISDYLKPDILVSEPAILFYGEKNSPNAILVIGSGNKKVFVIDVAKIEEEVAQIKETSENTAEEINNAAKTINNIIEACGLKFDSNKKENQVSYEPDIKDVVIRDAKSLADAVNILSKYAQELSQSLKFVVSDTSSVKLTYKKDENNNNINTLKAKVKISESGESDDEGFNNNIIGIKSDGLYAASHLEYDELRNELKYYSSGMKDGRFQDDAKKQVIKLGKHIEIVPNNSDKNPVKIDVVTENNKNKISASLSLSERDNILKITDGKLTALVSMSYNEATNEITFSNGIETKTFTLNVGGVVDYAYYDPTSESIVIRFRLTNGQTSEVKIPVRGILDEWTIDNTNKTVTLSKTNDTSLGKDILSADVNVSTKSDNILVKDGSTLYVGGVASNIRYKNITVAKALDTLEQSDVNIAQDLVKEINERTNAVENVLSKLKQETKDRKHADEDIIHLIEDLDVNGLKQTIEEFKTTYAEFEKEWASYKTQIEKAIADAEAVINKVYEIEKTLVETNTNLTNLTNRVATAEININNNASKIADNTLAITNEAALARQNETDIKTALEKEITRSIGVDDELRGLITTNKNDIENLKTTTGKLETELNSEIERAKGENNRLEGIINTNKEAIAENKANIGTISTSVAGLRNELENEVTRAQGEEKRLEGKITDLTDSAFAAINNALTQSKNYTDAEILKVKTDSAEDASNKANQALSEAKVYSDEKLALEIERAKAAEQTNADDIAKLKSKDAEIEANVANKVGSVRVEKNSQSDLQYILYVDDKPAGEINIPKDQFLKDVRYDVGLKSLVFTWELPDHPETLVNVSDFLTTYTAGDGLSLTENVFSVKLTTANESYLQVTADGIQLVGIDAKFNTKADKSDTYSKLEVDTIVESEAIRAKSAESMLQNNINDANIIVGEIANHLVEAESKLNIIQGNSAQEGSVLNAIKQSNDYTDAKINEVNTEISKKVDSKDVYTKTEIDSKGFLVTSDIENLANKNEVQTEIERAKAAEEQNKTAIENVKLSADTNTQDIAQLKKDVNSLEPNVTETNSVKMTMNKAANGTTFSSDVKLDLEKSNILKVSGNGLYAEVSLSYNTAENKLVFNAGGVEKDIQLSGASMIEDAYYNSATRQIVFVVKTQTGETKQVTVDVNDLINTLRVENPANSPVQLTLSQDLQGNDLLSANLIISTKEDNAILEDNGTLFVSKRAANMTGLWEENLDTNLQVIINNLKAKTDKVDELVESVKDIQKDLTETKINIQNQLNIFDNKINGQNDKITQLESRINDLDKTVKDIQKTLGGEGVSSILERLDKIEDFITTKLIDFGEY